MAGGSTPEQRTNLARRTKTAEVGGLDCFGDGRGFGCRSGPQQRSEDVGAIGSVPMVLFSHYLTFAGPLSAGTRGLDAGRVAEVLKCEAIDCFENEN